eukprot:681619-Amphidinium_carterae.1
MCLTSHTHKTKAACTHNEETESVHMTNASSLVPGKYPCTEVQQDKAASTSTGSKHFAMRENESKGSPEMCIQSVLSCGLCCGCGLCPLFFLRSGLNVIKKD